MDTLIFLALTTACAPDVDPITSRALVQVESDFNPFAIGVVHGQLVRQPGNAAEASATARALQAAGWNFSLGLGQINVKNLARLGLNFESAFDPCVNLRAMQSVLSDCFARAPGNTGDQPRLQRALSCYYSGNFQTGFAHGYVRRVRLAVAASSHSLP